MSYVYNQKNKERRKKQREAVQKLMNQLKLPYNLKHNKVEIPDPPKKYSVPRKERRMVWKLSKGSYKTKEEWRNAWSERHTIQN